MKHTPSHSHNYVPKVLALTSIIPDLGTRTQIVDIYHEVWCDVPNGGFCNCDPHVELRGEAKDGAP